VRPEHEGLFVDPCLGKEIAEFTVTRRCRGAVYEIRVRNSGGSQPARLTVDGELIQGNLVPYAAAGRSVLVEVDA
jgi:cellobiose phosphorylase